MNQKFEGWGAVGEYLRLQASHAGSWLNEGQCASLSAIADRLPDNGIILADEVGMGKTRIAVSLARAVTAAGGRVALLVPPGLGFQWQDEFNHGGIQGNPSILRSLWGYLEAWADEGALNPWFDHSIVTLSHAFANWRLSESSQTWRWEMLPMLYAQWRKIETGRLPRGSDKDHRDAWVKNAATSICTRIGTDESSPALQAMRAITENTPWPGALEPSEYSRDASLRPFLEKAVGLGLGVFDLVIIDEAHKSRGQESGLSRLLENIILHSADARRFAMTATPVELDVSQWKQTLLRIGVTSADKVDESIKAYAEAVRQVRQCWRSNEDARQNYAIAARAFQAALSPYLLRRDKRQDEAVQQFMRATGETHDSYRRENEILIKTNELPPAWREAICAAEALALVSERDDWMAKRLRLTIGNGHGIAAILDQVEHDEKEDKAQEDADSKSVPAEQTSETNPALSMDVAKNRTGKRQQRAEWWRSLMSRAFSGEGDGLYEHPAILKAVDEIELCMNMGEKVLVFGRFTRPMRALVDLLNARAMLHALESGTPWPQSKVHEMERESVEVAHRQLSCEIPFEEIDKHLEEQYRRTENRRARLRDQLFNLIDSGLCEQQADAKALLNAARNTKNDTRALLTRALDELMESPEHFEPDQCANAFVDLMTALRNRDEGDADGDGMLDEEEAENIWGTLEQRIGDEYGTQRGSFARLMNGETAHPTRRILQLAFNRERSFPKVLIAQSLVGREGLNLHRACRIVVLLHPEWNPGVVEQQIGRVDRVESRWARELRAAIENGSEIPRIEIRPVIFAGAYDEHNWKVLRERWDDLRAQLHGVVVPARERSGADGLTAALVEWIDKSGPVFHTNRTHE